MDAAWQDIKIRLERFGGFREDSGIHHTDGAEAASGIGQYIHGNGTERGSGYIFQDQRLFFRQDFSQGFFHVLKLRRELIYCVVPCDLVKSIWGDAPETAVVFCDGYGGISEGFVIHLKITGDSQIQETLMWNGV